MKQYLDLLDHILKNGEDRGDRTGTGVISSFGHQIRFDLKDGFPAVTTKSLAWKGVVSELLWFHEGSDVERRLAEIRFEKDRSELTDLSKFSTIWTDNADNEDGFIILRKVRRGEWSSVATISTPNTSSFTDTVPSIGTYLYRVLSVKSGEQSDGSNVVKIYNHTLF